MALGGDDGDERRVYNYSIVQLLYLAHSPLVVTPKFLATVDLRASAPRDSRLRTRAGHTQGPKGRAENSAKERSGSALWLDPETEADSGDALQVQSIAEFERWKEEQKSEAIRKAGFSSGETSAVPPQESDKLAKHTPEPFLRPKNIDVWDSSPSIPLPVDTTRESRFTTLFNTEGDTKTPPQTVPAPLHAPHGSQAPPPGLFRQLGQSSSGKHTSNDDAFFNSLLGKSSASKAPTSEHATGGGSGSHTPLFGAPPEQSYYPPGLPPHVTYANHRPSQVSPSGPPGFGFPPQQTSTHASAGAYSGMPPSLSHGFSSPDRMPPGLMTSNPQYAKSDLRDMLFAQGSHSAGKPSV